MKSIALNEKIDVLILTDLTSLEVMPKNIQNKRLKHSCSNQVKLFSLKISISIFQNC